MKPIEADGHIAENSPVISTTKQSAGLAWLASASNGFCSKTSEETGTAFSNGMKSGADCFSNTKGVLPNLPPHAWRSWETAATHCLRRCQQCNNCRFISLSLSYKDCSWYEECALTALQQDVSGFRSGSAARTNGTSRRDAASQVLHAMPQQWWTPNEVSTRYRELVVYSSRHSHNLSGLTALLGHPALQRSMWRGVRLSGSGRRWSSGRLKAHAESVYLAHNNQTAAQRRALARKWDRALIGRVKVLDLLFLLHFTIDHTDTFLGYTSQLIHCLQVFSAVSHPLQSFTRSKNARYHYPGSTAVELARYARDMRASALIHDVGKVLTLFGEADGSVRGAHRLREREFGRQMELSRQELNAGSQGRAGG